MPVALPLKPKNAAAAAPPPAKEGTDIGKILAASHLTNVEKAKLLFPEFAPDKKLRFSRLFGNNFSGRDLDRDWKYGKKKKKYKRIPKENGLWTKVQ